MNELHAANSPNDSSDNETARQRDAQNHDAQHQDARERDIAIRARLGIPPFTPHRWVRGGWLQTLSVKAMRPTLSIESWPGCQTLQIPDDHTPPDTLSGYFLPPNDPKRRTRSEPATVVILHGMGGHARSNYMLSMAERLLAANYNVLLWNHRGAGRSASECARFHHPGHTEDLDRLLTWMSDNRPEVFEQPLHAIAYSLGANLLLKYLAEVGARSLFSSAVSISAPLDMEVTSLALRTGSNRIFDRYLLAKQRSELLRDSANLSASERRTLGKVSSVWQLDDQFTAKRLGYDGAVEFYAENSAIHTIDQIQTPTLIIHAKDDPVVKPAVLQDIHWDGNASLVPLIAESGGHTGFYAMDQSRWHETAAVAFLTRN